MNLLRTLRLILSLITLVFVIGMISQLNTVDSHSSRSGPRFLSAPGTEEPESWFTRIVAYASTMGGWFSHDRADDGEARRNLRSLRRRTEMGRVLEIPRVRTSGGSSYGTRHRRAPTYSGAGAVRATSSSRFKLD